MAGNKNMNLSMVLVALLVVVIVIVGAYLYTRSPSSTTATTIPLVTTCSNQPNYMCQSPGYSSSTGNLTVKVEQNTGSNWSVATLIFVPQGTAYSYGVPIVSWSSGVSLSNGMQNGNLYTVKLPATGKTSLGSPISGTIWAQYQTNAGGTVYYAEVASVSGTAS